MIDSGGSYRLITCSEKGKECVSERRFHRAFDALIAMQEYPPSVKVEVVCVVGRSMPSGDPKSDPALPVENARETGHGSVVFP